MPSTIDTRPALLAIVLLAQSFSGCATLMTGWPKGAEKVEYSNAQRPIGQIVCLWNPAEGRDPEGKPCRGFAGQVMFMSARSAIPLAVKGNVRVYVFDNIGTTEEQTKPVHQFDFDPEIWDAHRQANTLGPAYNVFIPYMRKGNHAAVCSIRLRYIPEGGTSPLFSDMISVRFEGNQPASASASMKVDRFVGPAGSANEKTKQMIVGNGMSDPAGDAAQNPVRTTTISLDAANGPRPMSSGNLMAQDGLTRELAAGGQNPLTGAGIGQGTPGDLMQQMVDTQVSQKMASQTQASSARIRTGSAHPALHPVEADAAGTTGIVRVGYEEPAPLPERNPGATHLLDDEPAESSRHLLDD
ncbi:MAG: hypothetical protein C0478_08800 [Planctomyces sp.]|nr:hypothetical protein [Planctomyces sp.]